MPVRFPKRWFRKKKIILASGSPRRKELMDLTGLRFQVIPPNVDEKVLPEETPRDHVERLALQKATSVAASHQDDVVVGCDTVVILNGRHILGKPQKKKDAKQMLTNLFRWTIGRRLSAATNFRPSASSSQRFGRGRASSAW